MKSKLALALVFAMLISVLTGFTAYADSQTITLGTSNFTLTIPAEYHTGEITSDDTTENQVAYYLKDESSMDFDVYQWAKATDETLEDAIAEEAAEFDNAAVETATYNGINVFYYTAVEESEGESYTTVTYMAEDGDTIVELVFWMDGETAEAEVQEILNTLTLTEAAKRSDAAVELGTSGLYIELPEGYVAGEITSDDTTENQVAYYLKDESSMDFDVYQWAKATDETLEDAIAEEAAEFDNAEVEKTTINGFDLYYYTATEESEGESYETVTYMTEIGDCFVELVFWMDGEDAEAAVESILNTLTK